MIITLTFFTIRSKHSEIELENSLISKICYFLKELGGEFKMADIL